MLKEYVAFNEEMNPEVEFGGKVASEMLETLRYMADHESPDDRISKEMLCYYVRSLIDGQVVWPHGRKKLWAWVVAPTSEDMPNEARFDFVFIPTTVAVATLTLFRRRFPAEAGQVRGFDTVLRRGMLFSTLRNFAGHGYEATKGLIQTLNIFALGKVPGFLHENPKFCPVLYRTLTEATDQMQADLAAGKTSGPWGEDYREDYENCLAVLKND